MLQPPAMWTVLAILLPLVTLHLSSAASLNTHPSTRHKRSSDSRVDLDALKDSLDSLAENGLPEDSAVKRGCALGLNSHHCAIAALDDLMRGSDYLRGGFSPGKRDSQMSDSGDFHTRANMLLRSLDEQMRAVATLRGLLNRRDDEVKQQQKRTCAFRLGNHCLTEALDRAASTYYYLRSPQSPGRRRRHASLIKALQQQQVNEAAGDEGSEDSVAEVRRKREAETEEEAPASAAAGDAAATDHGDAALRRRRSLKAVNLGDTLYETATRRP